MRFHEVRTKSALNRVPAASRVPFNWTVNPYRGCSHACVYCLAGDTLILLADGGVRPLADLRVGDRIYGTPQGSLRRPPRCSAHWSDAQAGLSRHARGRDEDPRQRRPPVPLAARVGLRRHRGRRVRRAGRERRRAPTLSRRLGAAGGGAVAPRRVAAT